jgi:hypothetical protein
MMPPLRYAYDELVARVRSARQVQDMHELDRMIDTYGLEVVEQWVRGARAMREPEPGLLSDPRR